MKRNAVIKIRGEAAGNTVVDYLTRRFTYHDRTRWQASIREGKVLLDERPASADDRLTVGATLAYVDFDATEPPVRSDYGILFEDASLMVVDKPGNLPCHPGGRYFEHTLWHLLKSDFGLDSLSFVNRIDRETSGIVLVAKTPLAARECRRQFDTGNVEKRYLVAVAGDFPGEACRAEGYLCRDTASPVRKKLKFVSLDALPPSTSRNNNCRTVFRRVARGRVAALVAAEPVTGRLHQIRATLCSLGYPVVGDKLYGVDDTFFIRFIEDRLSPEDKARLVLPRQALHARFLGLRHPVSGRPMAWTAPMPADMAGLFDF